MYSFCADVVLNHLNYLTKYGQLLYQLGYTMDLRVKTLAAKCYNLSLSPGTHMVEGKNQVLQDVL